MTPAEYEAWYHTPRGRWVSDSEFRLLTRLLQPQPGQRLLDVGCGTGHFTRRFAGLGLHTTGIDIDPQMIAFARGQDSRSEYLTGSMNTLPFANGAFEHVTAITSLCFVEDYAPALREMWRVCRGTLCLGLLNKHSLLYRQKHGRGAYRGARWDTVFSLKASLAQLDPPPAKSTIRTAIFSAGYSATQRKFEYFLPHVLPWGAFLAIALRKPDGQAIP